MAHNLNIEAGKATMMSVGKVPWHGLGTVLDQAPRSVAEALQAAALNWDVGLKSVFCADGQHYYEIPDKKAIVRLDHWGTPNCVPFALVGNDYQVLQNREAFEFFDPIVQSSKVSFETAGALGAGERVWVLAKVHGDVEIAKNDVIQRYLLLSTGHDAKTAVEIRFTPVRVVCQNTLTLAQKSGASLGKAYHVPGLGRVLKSVQLTVESLLESFASLEGKFKQMAQKSLNEELLSKYLQGVFPDPERRKNQSEESYEKQLRAVQQTRTEAARYFTEGVGNASLEVRGTLWAAYNGITELIDHHTSYRDPWQRLESSMFGEAQRVKQQAFDTACEILAA